MDGFQPSFLYSKYPQLFSKFKYSKFRINYVAALIFAEKVRRMVIHFIAVKNNVKGNIPALIIMKKL